jgi:hypothetical protein
MTPSSARVDSSGGRTKILSQALSIRPGATVLQRTGRGVGQVEGVIEFAISEQSGIAGDLGTEEWEPETAVELESERLGWAVTHEVGSSNGQEVVGNPGICRVLAQLSRRFWLFIWEIWVEYDLIKPFLSTSSPPCEIVSRISEKRSRVAMRGM